MRAAFLFPFHGVATMPQLSQGMTISQCCMCYGVSDVCLPSIFCIVLNHAAMPVVMSVGLTVGFPLSQMLVHCASLLVCVSSV